MDHSASRCKRRGVWVWVWVRVWGGVSMRLLCQGGQVSMRFLLGAVGGWVGLRGGGLLAGRFCWKEDEQGVGGWAALEL